MPETGRPGAAGAPALTAELSRIRQIERGGAISCAEIDVVTNGRAVMLRPPLAALSGVSLFLVYE